MKNPGLTIFSVPLHPLNEEILEGDPDYDSEHYTEMAGNPDFGRWKNPGHPIVRYPVEQGKPFGPGDKPEDVIHGEMISPEEQDAADRILNGEHESDKPSGSSPVEDARQDLRTPGSSVAVHALSNLLRGGDPSSMSDEEMESARSYLSQHFSGVRINPRHGTILAGSPYGAQMVKRHVNLPAVPEGAPGETHEYSLTNKHGVFASEDPKRLIRAMVAFQIVHNEIAERQKKKDSLTATSGFFSGLRDAFMEGYEPREPLKTPSSAVFEPGKGIDFNHQGVAGGYVAPAEDAPEDWHRDTDGIAYSPGHHMRLMLDPQLAKIPHADVRRGMEGHSWTYAPNHDTGHTNFRHNGEFGYYVNRMHPAVRGEGFDLPESSAPTPTPAPRMPKRYPGGRAPSISPKKSAQVNDLCPVCASGYLEPYDNDYHECLNCGSLVSHVGFEKQAARARGLGRGLNQIKLYEGDPLKLDSEKTTEEEEGDNPSESYVHPLAGLTSQDPEFEPYEAPRDRLMDRKASPGGKAGETLDERLGKFGFKSAHKYGQARMYYANMPGDRNAYARLTEGPGKDKGSKVWTLTADHIHSPEQWMKNGEPYQHGSVPFQFNFDAMNPAAGGIPTYINLVNPSNRQHSIKTILAQGHHPLHDENLHRAIRDVMANGKNSETYRNATLDTAYEPPRLPTPTPQSTQRDLRQFSSLLPVGNNPGRTRFVE